VSTRSVSLPSRCTYRTACSGSDLPFSDPHPPVPRYVYRLVMLTGEVISCKKPFIIPSLLSPCINLPYTHPVLYTIPLSHRGSLLSTTANMLRPAKKRCQFKVVYNIPTLPKEGDKPTDGSPPPKPEMTANPTQCPSAAMRIAGDCPHCQKVFCSGHRTPESHHWYVWFPQS